MDSRVGFEVVVVVPLRVGVGCDCGCLVVGMPFVIGLVVWSTDGDMVVVRLTLRSISSFFLCLSLTYICSEPMGRVCSSISFANLILFIPLVLFPLGDGGSGSDEMVE